MSPRLQLVSTCLLLPLRTLAMAAPALALAAPVAAQTGSHAAPIVALGSFASEADANARAVITATAEPGAVHLNFYGVEQGRSKPWFSAELKPAPNGRDLVGTWRDRSGFLFATVRVTPLGDQRSINIAFDEPMDSIATQSLPALHLGLFHAETRDDRPAPLPGPQPAPRPSPPVLTPPQPPAPPSGPVASTGFKPLRRVDVRLDRLWEARGYPTRQVHAFVTVRNVSAQPQYITSGYLKAVLSDSDGVAQERNQVWRASAEPAALFNSTPVVQPGAELKIRYVFIPDDGSQPATLTLSEGDKRAEFPAGGF